MTLFTLCVCECVRDCVWASGRSQLSTLRLGNLPFFRAALLLLLGGRRLREMEAPADYQTSERYERAGAVMCYLLVKVGAHGPGGGEAPRPALPSFSLPQNKPLWMEM